MRFDQEERAHRVFVPRFLPEVRREEREGARGVTGMKERGGIAKAREREAFVEPETVRLEPFAFDVLGERPTIEGGGVESHSRRLARPDELVDVDGGLGRGIPSDSPMVGDDPALLAVEFAELAREQVEVAAHIREGDVVRFVRKQCERDRFPRGRRVAVQEQPDEQGFGRGRERDGRGSAASPAGDFNFAEESKLHGHLESGRTAVMEVSRSAAGTS